MREKTGAGLRLKRDLKKYFPLYLIIVPIMAVYFLFCYIPLIDGVVMSFQKFIPGKSIFEASFNQLQNYRVIFTDAGILQALRNTVVISVLKIIFGFFPPIILAIFIFDIKLKLFKRATQTLLYIPYFFSWVIVYGIFFALFASNTGFINQLLIKLGIGNVEFFTSEGWFLFLIVLSSVWKGMGWSSILFLAALTSISGELYEAAKIDGCGPWQRILHITIPGILPVASFVLTMSMGSILGSDFEQILMFYNDSVFSVGDVLSTWIYRVGLGDLKNYGAGIAVGLLNGVISMVLVLSANKAATKVSGRGLW